MPIPLIIFAGLAGESFGAHIPDQMDAEQRARMFVALDDGFLPLSKSSGTKPPICGDDALMEFLELEPADWAAVAVLIVTPVDASYETETITELLQFFRNAGFPQCVQLALVPAARFSAWKEQLPEPLDRRVVLATDARHARAQARQELPWSEIERQAWLWIAGVSWLSRMSPPVAVTVLNATNHGMSSLFAQDVKPALATGVAEWWTLRQLQKQFRDWDPMDDDGPGTLTKPVECPPLKLKRYKVITFEHLPWLKKSRERVLTQYQDRFVADLFKQATTWQEALAAYRKQLDQQQAAAMEVGQQAITGYMAVDFTNHEVRGVLAGKSAELDQSLAKLDTCEPLAWPSSRRFQPAVIRACLDDAWRGLKSAAEPLRIGYWLPRMLVAASIAVGAGAAALRFPFLALEWRAGMSLIGMAPLGVQGFKLFRARRHFKSLVNHGVQQVIKLMRQHFEDCGQCLVRRLQARVDDAVAGHARHLSRDAQQWLKYMRLQDLASVQGTPWQEPTSTLAQAIGRAWPNWLKNFATDWTDGTEMVSAFQAHVRDPLYECCLRQASVAGIPAKQLAEVRQTAQGCVREVVLAPVLNGQPDVYVIHPQSWALQPPLANVQNTVPLEDGYALRGQGILVGVRHDIGGDLE